MDTRREKGGTPALDATCFDAPQTDAQRARAQARCAIDLERLARIAGGFDAAEIFDAACGFLANAIGLHGARLVLGDGPDARAHEWRNVEAPRALSTVQVDLPGRERFGVWSSLSVHLCATPSASDRRFLEGFVFQLSRVYERLLSDEERSGEHAIVGDDDVRVRAAG